MKFDRDGDGDFDLKDVLIMATLIGTIFNFVLNFFNFLGLGISLTSQNQPVLECKVVRFEGQNQLKCFKPEDAPKL